MPQESEQIILTVVAGTIILLTLGSFILYFLFLYQHRHNKYLDEVGQIKSQYEQELLRSQLEIQELTLSHISQEIHDNIGQMLTVVKVQLGSIETTDANVVLKLENSFKILTRTIQDLRNLSRNLNTDYIQEKGLIHCISEELSVLEISGVLKTGLIVQGDLKDQNPHWELIVFRILQELLNNTLKHANSTNINILVDYQSVGLMLKVSDNGVGFDPSTITTSNSLGLRSIKKRVTVLGGHLNIESASFNGTTIQVFLPY